MDPKPQRGLSFKRLVFDYAKWSTVVCLNKIATSVKWLAIIYAIVLVFMLGLFIAISTNLIIKYFKFPSSTELSIDPFPRFSFCNENPLKRSVVDADPAFAQIAKLMKQFDQLELKTLVKDDFGIGTSAMKMQRLSRGRTMLRLLMHQLSDADRIRGGYSFSELVSECTFAGKTCSSADFTMFLHPDYGVCFTFAKEKEVTKAGVTQGLRMLMTVNQDSSRFQIFDFLPTSDSANIRGLLHLPEDYPDMTNDALKVAARTQASIAFSLVNHTRSPAPYDNCTQQGEMGADDYYANFTYTFASCQNSCLQRLAWEHCKCVDPLYRKADEHTYCATPADMLCLVNLPSLKAAATAATGTHVCDCHPPCTEQSFEQTVTYGIFPSGKYAVATGTQAQRDLLLFGQGGGRGGVGNDYWDDYDGGTTTTTSTTSKPTTTTTTLGTYPPNTTPEPTCPPVLLSLEESLAAIGPAASECRTGAQFSLYYNNPKFTTIQGWPCLSTKKCRTCILFSDPAPVWDWPCTYTGYEQCRNYNNQGTTNFPCSTSGMQKDIKFFTLFDFIPTGVNAPNITNWAGGKQPADSPCKQLPSASVERLACWANADCRRVPSSSNLTFLARSPLIDSAFWKSVDDVANTTTCELSRLALAAARRKLNLPVVPVQSSGTGSGSPSGRKRRSALNSAEHAPSTTKTSASNETVDLPGYGSCEYANKNFKGAAECNKWYQRNGLILEMYYDSLQVRTYTQSGTYSLATMLADVGGHAGLWLGISVVSLVEFVALLVMCVNKLFRGDKIIVGVGGITTAVLLEFPFIFGYHIEIDSFICDIIMFLPETGIAIGCASIFCIGLDRMLSVLLSAKYRVIDKRFYYSFLASLIFGYCGFFTFLMIVFYRNGTVMCQISTPYFEGFMYFIGSNILFNLASTIVYAITFTALGTISDSAQMKRIGKSLFIIVTVDVVGWFLTPALMQIAIPLGFDAQQTLAWTCFCPLFIGIAITVKLYIYYATSTEYRSAFETVIFKKSSMKKTSFLPKATT